PDRGCPGPAGPPPRFSAPLGGDFLGQLREGRRIGDGELGQDLPIEHDAGVLEPGHEHGVREPHLPTRRVHADDPEGARPALLLLAPRIGEGPRPEDGLRRFAVELAASPEVALRLLEDLLPALAGLGPALGPWHLSLLLRGRARAGASPARPPSRSWSPC